MMSQRRQKLQLTNVPMMKPRGDDSTGECCIPSIEVLNNGLKGLGRVNGVSFHNTRPWILVGTEGKRILIWDYEADTVLWSSSTTAPAWAVDFHPTRSLLAVGTGAHSISLFDYFSNRQFRKHMVSHTSAFEQESVRSVCFHPDGSIPWLLSTGDDKKARVWNTFSGLQVAVVDFNDGGVSAKWVPGSPLTFVVASADGLVHQATIVGCSSSLSSDLPLTVSQLANAEQLTVVVESPIMHCSVGANCVDVRRLSSEATLIVGSNTRQDGFWFRIPSVVSLCLIEGLTEVTAPPPPDGAANTTCSSIVTPSCGQEGGGGGDDPLRLTSIARVLLSEESTTSACVFVGARCIVTTDSDGDTKLSSYRPTCTAPLSVRCPTDDDSVVVCHHTVPNPSSGSGVAPRKGICLAQRAVADAPHRQLVACGHEDGVALYVVADPQMQPPPSGDDVIPVPLVVSPSIPKRNKKKKKKGNDYFLEVDEDETDEVETTVDHPEEEKEEFESLKSGGDTEQLLPPVPAGFGVGATLGINFNVFDDILSFCGATERELLTLTHVNHCWRAYASDLPQWTSLRAHARFKPRSFVEVQTVLHKWFFPSSSKKKNNFSALHEERRIHANLGQDDDDGNCEALTSNCPPAASFVDMEPLDTIGIWDLSSWRSVQKLLGQFNLTMLEAMKSQD